MTVRKRVCVIGAGPSGIAAAKNCVASGFDVIVFEQNDRVGGNWVFNAQTGHSSVYENTHIISSKTWSEYEDFPMPADYPDYPSHRQLQVYFERYAQQFGVAAHIRFNHEVRSVKPCSAGWRVEYRDADGVEQSATYDAVMVANGHHWNPKYPQYPGSFNGTFMHSHDFKGVGDDWRGKNVLIIGGGNSACDVAVEAARVAGSVCVSMRNPQWFVPKFIFGEPSDVFAARTAWLPRKLRQRIFARLLTALQGRYATYGLPMNTDLPLDQHPTLNSDFIEFVRHGRIAPRPGIERLTGDGVVFTDGRREAFDIICACTGFWITFPFFERTLIDFQHARRVPLLYTMMHADHPTLYFIGLFQPIGCIWPLADYQALLACQELAGNFKRPANMRAAIAREVDHPRYRFSGGIRHSTEVDYLGLRNQLKTALKTTGIDIGAPPRGFRERYKLARSSSTAAHRAGPLVPTSID